MMYRVVNGFIAIPASSYLIPNTRSTIGHSHKFQVPPASINAFQYSFFPAAIRVWNSLPADVVLCPSIETFKARLMDITLHLHSSGLRIIHFFVIVLPHNLHLFLSVWILLLQLFWAHMHSNTQL